MLSNFDSIDDFFYHVIALLAVACIGTPTDQATRIETAVPGPTAAAQRVVLPSGKTLEVAGGVAILRGPDSATLAENAQVARGPDPGGVCPADGFRGAEPVGKGFVLRNQLCSGWFFIEEVMTFAPSGDDYLLIRFSAAYLNRRTAQPNGSPRVLTEAKLGHRRFQDLDPDDLYPLLD